MNQITEVDDSAKQRYAVLAPYLDRLDGGEAGGSTLDPWEKSVLEQTIVAADSTSDDWAILVAQGIALQSKYRDDRRPLETSDSIPPETLTTLHAQLMTDAAIGLALMEETQRAIDLMVLSGQIDEAKKLTGFRTKLVQTVSRIKETIGPTAYRAAETLSAKMVPPQEDKLATGTAEDREPPPAFIKRTHTTVKPTPAPKPKKRKTASIEDRTKPLIALLAVLILAWVVFILPRLNRERLPVITEQEMPQSAAIRELMARPPSLFIEVDSQTWNAMSAADRRQLVKEVGEVAEASGYTGVQFRDSTGISVAQWLLTQGVWLASSSAY
jgi:hypothetical protein